MSQSPLPALRIGLAGLGTVGIGVVKIVQRHGDLLAARAGRRVEIVAVSARDPKKDRGVDLSGYAWESDPVALAKRGDIDVFVEVMGGHEGPARLATEAAIAAGRAPVEGSADDNAGKLALANGDSLSVFVRYALSKSRTVEIDAAQGVASGDAGASAGTSASKFRFPNGDLLVAASNDSDSATGTHLVEWKFVATA